VRGSCTAKRRDGGASARSSGSRTRSEGVA
jgi:hypothetical protein